MAYTEVKVIVGTAGKFNAAMAEAISEGFQPVSDVTVEGSQVYSVIVAKGSEYSITEAKVLNASSRKSLFTQMESASAQGFTVDSASVSLESGQQFAFVYKGSKGGGATSVAWGEVTGKPATFATNAASITDAGATGRTILQAANGPAARTALGASATGSSLMIAADAAAARTAIGAGAPYTLPSATTAIIGGVKGGFSTGTTPAVPGSQVPAAVGTDVAALLAELNALITSYNATRSTVNGLRDCRVSDVTGLRSAGIFV